MNPDWWATGAALAAALVAIVAAAYSGSQARTAKKALATTEDQAASARQSVEISRAADLRAERPTFEIALDPPDHGECVVHVRMTGGPAQIKVRAVWTLRTFWPDPDGLEQATTGGSPGNPHLLVKGDRIKLHPVVPITDPARVSVRVILESRAADYGEPREWTHPETVEWIREQPVPGRIVRE